MRAESDYLIIGSSHAALAALSTIRLQETEKTVTVLTRDRHFPYSPTLLPYVVSGDVRPEAAILCDEAFFEARRVRFERSAAVAAVRPETREVTLEDGATWHYDKLLLATGATPVLPAIAGLSEVRFHSLRSLDDSLALCAELGRARSAVVLGAGLIGMHAAENLAKAGIAVTVIEQRAEVLSGYFDAEAAGLIAARFASHGVAFRLGCTVAATTVQPRQRGLSLRALPLMALPSASAARWSRPPAPAPGARDAGSRSMTAPKSRPIFY